MKEKSKQENKTINSHEITGFGDISDFKMLWFLGLAKRGMDIGKEENEKNKNTI